MLANQPEEYYKKLLLIHKLKNNLTQKDIEYIFKHGYCWDIIFKIKSPSVSSMIINYIRYYHKDILPEAEEALKNNPWVYVSYSIEYKKTYDEHVEHIFRQELNKKLARKAKTTMFSYTGYTSYVVNFVKYCSTIINRPLYEFHDIFKEFPVLAYKHECFSLYVKRFYLEFKKHDPDLIELYEHYLCKQRYLEHYAYAYLKKYVKKPSKKFEPLILKDYELIYSYSKNLIKGRWPEGEKQLLKLYEKAMGYNKPGFRSPLIEKIEHFIYLYVREVIKGPWKEAETIIKNSDHWADYREICKEAEKKRSTQ